jgi:hypothetical protein
VDGALPIGDHYLLFSSCLYQDPGQVQKEVQGHLFRCGRQILGVLSGGDQKLIFPAGQKADRVVQKE